ncbi:MAG: toll/interleukin-1 receptor domain-containing protein [Anaerolineae bacterium]
MSDDYLFISHANADNDTAKKLYDQLKALTKRRCWIDDVDLKPPVPDWDAALDKAVKASAGGVLLLSRNILNRPNVTAEWRYLLDKVLARFFRRQN